MNVKLDYFYIFPIVVVFLCALIPLIPDMVRYIATVFLLVYIGVNSKHISVQYFRWIIAFLCFSIISTFWALKLNLALWGVFQFLFAVIPGIATSIYISDIRKLRKVLFVFYLCVFVMMAYTIAVGGLDTEGVRFGKTLNEEDDAPVWNSNAIGMNICFALFAGYVLFMRRKMGFVKLSFIVVSIIMILVILMTGSRKSFIILFIPIITFSCFRLKKNFLIIAILLPVVAFLGFNLIMRVSIIYDILGTRLDDMMNVLTGDTDGSEDISRLVLVQLGWQWFLENPIWGYGINCFRVLSNQTIYFEGKSFYAHNNYIEMLVDIGIAGALIYYSGYYYLFKKTIRRNTYSLAWCFVLMIILVFRDFVVVSYYSSINQVIIGVIFSIIRINDINNNKNFENYEISRHSPTRLYQSNNRSSWYIKKNIE